MFSCLLKSVSDICVKSLREGGDVATLLEGPTWKGMGGWLSDGSFVYWEQNQKTNMDLMVMPSDRKGEPRVLLRTPFREMWPEPSPDGRWVAYLSDETGRDEVYVRSSRRLSRSSGRSRQAAAGSPVGAATPRSCSSRPPTGRR